MLTLTAGSPGESTVTLKAIAINCSLKRSTGEPSSTDAMIGLIVSELKHHQVEFTETIRIADHDILPGVTSDEGAGDAWPDIRRKILDADILIFGTPIWLGQMSSVAKRVVERMDAFLSETEIRAGCRASANSRSQRSSAMRTARTASPPTCSSAERRRLDDPIVRGVLLVGEAMHKIDFRDLPRVPDEVAEAAAMLASMPRSGEIAQQQAYPGVAAQE